MSTLALTTAELRVTSAWLDREVGLRAGKNLREAVVDTAELVALIELAEAMRAQMTVCSGDDAILLSAARTHLTPEETEIHVETNGTEALTGLPVAGDHPVDLDAQCAIVLANDVLLVLFEFLCREIAERNGRNLSASFVSVAEFWALNAAQCVLEKGEFYSALRDYREQVECARKALSANAPAGFVPSGREG